MKIQLLLIAFLSVTFIYSYKTKSRLSCPQIQLNETTLNCFNDTCIHIDNEGNVNINCDGYYKVDNDQIILAYEGSDITLHNPAQNLNLSEWEFIKNTTPQFILQHYANTNGGPTIYAAYKNRVTFEAANNSITLQNINANDTGTYKATVDLDQKNALRFMLIVLERAKPTPTSKINTPITDDILQEESAVNRIVLTAMGLSLTANIIMILMLYYVLRYNRVGFVNRAQFMVTEL